MVAMAGAIRQGLDIWQERQQILHLFTPCMCEEIVHIGEVELCPAGQGLYAYMVYKPKKTRSSAYNY